MWFLAPPKHCALAVRGGRRVDVLGDRRRADEADGPDAVVGQQGIDGLLVSVHDVEHAGGESCLEEQLGDAHRHRGIPLAGLEHHGVACGQRGPRLPQRDHGGEVERGDRRDDAEGLPHRVDVDSRTGAGRVFALEQVRSPRGELDDLEAPLDVALRVVDGLAVLAREQLGERLHLALHQIEESQQHASALLGVRRGPLDLCGLGVREHVGDLAGGGQRHARLDGSGARIEHVGEAAPFWGEVLSAYEVGNGTSHCAMSLRAIVGTMTMVLRHPFNY